MKTSDKPIQILNVTSTISQLQRHQLRRPIYQVRQTKSMCAKIHQARQPKHQIHQTKKPNTPNKRPSTPKYTKYAKYTKPNTKYAKQKTKYAKQKAYRRRKTPSTPSKTQCTPKKHQNFHLRCFVAKICYSKFTHFVGVLFTGLKSMVVYKNGQI